MPRKALNFLSARPPAEQLIPLGIGLVAAAVELGGESARRALRYDRMALEAGEWWRLLSGHLVHLGPAHMLMNVCALGVLVLVLSPFLRGRDWLWVGLAAALAIDGGLYWLNPGIGWYVGLSGVLHGFWSGACILGIRCRGWQAAPLALLLLVKLGYENLLGPVPLTGTIAAGPVVTAAHAWGAAGGALAGLALIATRSRRPSL